MQFVVWRIVLQLEDHFYRNESHHLFKSVRELEGKPKKSLSAVKDSNSENGDRVLTLWKEHFERHLNTSFPHNEDALLALQENTPALVNNLQGISKDEVEKAISRRKAPRYDKISWEVLKAGGQTIIDILHKIFNSIWSQEKTPEDFSRMIVSPIHKKEDILQGENYRAISLLLISGKVFLQIILNKMKDKVDEKLSESQFGFWPGRGTVDIIFFTRQIIEKAREKNIPIHFHFIDFKAAFETIWRNALLKMLNVIGIEEKIVNILKYMYDNTKCCVMIDGKLTEWFQVMVMFNVFLEFVMDDVKSLNEFHSHPDMSTDVRYVDYLDCNDIWKTKFGHAWTRLLL